MSTSKIDEETTSERKPGLFEPGGPGGPGRRAGSRNKATLALDKIADDAGEDILNAMVGAAKSGDLRAADTGGLMLGSSTMTDSLGFSTRKARIGIKPRRPRARKRQLVATGVSHEQEAFARR